MEWLEGDISSYSLLSKWLAVSLIRYFENMVSYSTFDSES
jgi:hypothetical protein